MTIPEGSRVKSITKIIAAKTKISADDVTKALKDPDAIGLPAVAKGNPEGYLFPATYSVGAKTTATDLLKQMVAKTVAVSKDLDIDSRARALGLDGEQVLTVASILEFEAKKDFDYPKVARVLNNRLNDGMLLQLDSTVSFASGREGDVFTMPAERNSDSLNNTYKVSGLPPGPHRISGEKTIKAALNPASGSWLYFVAVNLETGETVFSNTKAEYDRAVTKLEQYCRAADDKTCRCAAPSWGCRSPTPFRRPCIGRPTPSSVSPVPTTPSRSTRTGSQPFLSALGDDVRGSPSRPRSSDARRRSWARPARSSAGSAWPTRSWWRTRACVPTTRTSRAPWPPCSNAALKRLARHASSAAERPRPRWHTRCRRSAPNASSSSYASRPVPQRQRQVAKAAGLAVTVHTIEEPLIDKLDLLISTVPAEVVGSRSHELVDSSRAVFDVVYDPWPHRSPRLPNRPAYASCPDSTCWLTKPRCRWSS